MTETQKKLRKENLIKNTKKLDDAGISYKSFNNGIHLKVGCYDYFPSTDLFVHIRASYNKNYGINNLIKKLNIKKEVFSENEKYTLIKKGKNSFKIKQNVNHCFMGGAI